MYLLHLWAVSREVGTSWIDTVSEEIQAMRGEMIMGEVMLTGWIGIEIIGEIGTGMIIEGTGIEGIEIGIEIAKGDQIVIGTDHVEILPVLLPQVLQTLLRKGRPPRRVRHP